MKLAGPGMPTHAVMDVVESLLYGHLCSGPCIVGVQFSLFGFCTVCHLKFRWIIWGVALTFHEGFCDHVAFVSCPVEIDVEVWVVRIICNWPTNNVLEGPSGYCIGVVVTS